MRAKLVQQNRHCKIGDGKDAAGVEAFIRNDIQSLTRGAIERGQVIEIADALGDDDLQMKFVDKLVEGAVHVPCMQEENGVALILRKGVRRKSGRSAHP